MILQVRVITNAREVSIEEVTGLSPHGDCPFVAEYKVKLRARPIQGEANRELIELLAGYFKVTKSSIRIIRGERSKNKVVQITKYWRVGSSK